MTAGPVHIMLEVTQRCNSRCVYCYNVWKEEGGYPKGELPFAEIRRILDRVLEEVALESLTLTGGEPTLRNDLEQIASYAASNKIAVSLATNAVLIDKERAASLVGAGIKSFEIPILSTDRKVHNALARNDAYDKACEAITELKAREAAVTVVFVAMKENSSHFSGVAELAFALGSDAVMIDRFLAGGEGRKNASSLEPGAGQLIQLAHEAESAASRYGYQVSLGIPYPAGLVEAGDFRKLRFGACGAGKNKWAIDPLGNLRLCEQHPKPLGNLLETPFSELSVIAGVSLPDACASCGHFA